MKNIIIWMMLLQLLTCCNKSKKGLSINTAYTVYETEVKGLSGLTLGRDGKSFLAVSDKYGIYNIDTTGSLIRKLPYNGSNDFEGVTVNQSNGLIYLADEASMSIFQLSGDEQLVTTVAHIIIDNGVNNKGIEGIAYGNDTLYVVNQESPTMLIKFALGSRTETTRNPVSFAQFLSDICFDRTDNSLWICDSQQKIIFHCDLSGNVIASQEIDYVDKAEAIAIDRPNNIAWIGCDATGKLYKIKLKI